MEQPRAKRRKQEPRSNCGSRVNLTIKIIKFSLYNLYNLMFYYIQIKLIINNIFH